MREDGRHGKQRGGRKEVEEEGRGRNEGASREEGRGEERADEEEKRDD